MIKMPVKEFKNIILGEPDWASRLKEATYITEYCDLRGSRITHLSPLLHFQGRNKEGSVACFSSCENLLVAEGNFYGHVEFTNSGVHRIDTQNFRIHCPDEDGYAADFDNCENLKTMEGNFPGFVYFICSNIQTIGDIQITQPNCVGEYLWINQTPIENDETQMKKLVQTLFGKKPTKELEEIRFRLNRSEIQLNQFIGMEIKKRLETAQKKNKAVEIQID
jgi:hypothetical protein